MADQITWACTKCGEVYDEYRNSYHCHMTASDAIIACDKCGGEHIARNRREAAVLAENCGKVTKTK